jgi:hypothetical protein
MRIESVLLAEAVTADARGALAVIGINQNIFLAATLPATIKRAILAHVVEDPGIIQPNARFSFSLKVTGPRGNVILAQTASVAVANVPWPSLPATTDLPLELALNLSEYGTYRFDVEIQPPGDGDLLTGHVDMYVVRPEDQVVPDDATASA